MILAGEFLNFFDKLFCTLCIHGTQHAGRRKTFLDAFYAVVTVKRVIVLRVRIREGVGKIYGVIK